MLSSPAPAEGSGLVGKKVSMVDCGQALTADVMRDGSLLLWGRGHEWQLVLGQVERLNVPTILSAQACRPWDGAASSWLRAARVTLRWRERACKVGATTLQPWIFRLISNVCVKRVSRSHFRACHTSVLSTPRTFEISGTSEL
jgi:hypothetical protein